MKFKPLLGSDLSGHLGGIVASHGPYGPYLRQRVKPVQPQTAGQVAQRAAIAYVSGLWRSLTAAVIQSWGAANIQSLSNSGQSVTLTGQAAFMQLNTLRRRLGLSMLSSPPVGVTPVAMTTPVVVFTSASAVTITYGGDAWNAAQGGVIVSGALLTSTGRSYAKPSRAISTSVAPGLVAVAVTLPFSVPKTGRLRLRFHATAPDGRQSPYVDVDATNASYDPPPPASATVLNVTKVGTNTVLWLFNRAITVTPGADVNLKVAAVGSTAIAQAGPNGCTALYASSVTPAMPWSVVLQPTTIAETVIIPQSGLVQ